jgi:selenocysteine lyase/cysteine desulfurase
MIFDKSTTSFPAKEEMTFLAHCGISPMYKKAAERAIELITEQQRHGATTFMNYYGQELEEFKHQFSHLMHTSPDNIAAVRNTSEAISMIANGYPFEPGDEVISFMHEYPANHYPWRLQERRGVRLKLLSNIPAREDIDQDMVGKWSLEELERQITPKTKVIAVSHTQFTSGFAVDIQKLGNLCKENNIDLVVDVAQSLGSMPVFPEEYNIAALASAGWKWLMGPFGIGVFYTSPAFREKIAITQIGAETMQQGMNYLDHNWTPHPTAKRFEYSSSSITHVAALATCVREIHAHYGAENIYTEIIRLQDVFLDELENPAFKPLIFNPENRSGILSVYCEQWEAFANVLEKEKTVCALRSGFIRVAPHFYNTEEDMKRLAKMMNRGVKNGE